MRGAACVIGLFVAAGCRLGFDDLAPDDGGGSASDGGRVDGDGAVDGPGAPGIDAAAGGVDAPALACPVGYIGTPTMASRYLAIDDSESWLVAQQRCEADGTHLVVVDDAAELAAVRALLPGTDAWTGVTSRVVTGQWRAVTGPLATYLPWLAGEPDEPGGACVFIDGAAAGLVDQGCDSGRRIVCECDGLAVVSGSY